MNSVTLTGIITNKIEGKFRELIYDAPFNDREGLDVRHIKVKYWSNQLETRLMKIEDFKKVLIHGHLEEHEKFGTILLAEELEVIS